MLSVLTLCSAWYPYALPGTPMLSVYLSRWKGPLVNLRYAPVHWVEACMWVGHLVNHRHVPVHCIGASRWVGPLMSPRYAPFHWVVYSK